MPKRPSISLAFPTRNRPHETEQTLRILRETVSIPYEVLILDNSDVASPFALRENERVFFMEGNRGTFARNRAVSEANAPFLCMLDDDSHPLPGSLEHACRLLEDSEPDVAGVTARVERPDGGIENPPLLPTAFHGCGALFRTAVLREFEAFYPDDFGYYGEEYWSTLLLYSHGYHLRYSSGFRICHRMSAAGRDRSSILYRLTRNNRKTWAPLVPKRHLAAVESDTARRYELIARKEGVSDAFVRGMTETVSCSAAQRLTETQFRDFSLLSVFERIPSESLQGKPALLCSCGKFPTLWAECLSRHFGTDVFVADFNPGLVGHTHGGSRVLGPDEAIGKILAGQATPIIGHSSRFDSHEWGKQLTKRGIHPVRLAVTELNGESP